MVNESTAGRVRRAASGALAAALLAAAPAAAELVVLAGGGVLKVHSYRVEGERVLLRLPGSGSLTLPLSRVERIVDDELATPESAGDSIDGEAAGGRILFREGDPVPQVPFGDLIFETARRFRINPQLVAVMVRTESDFDPRAVSRKGAIGLLQLMPATADRFGVARHRLYEPESNLEAGVRYLEWLSRRYPGDLPRILAAYNAGEANVDRYRGVPPFRETREYVRRIYDRLGLAASEAPTAR